MNKLLQRQIQKYIGDTEELPENFKTFLKVVSESYDHYEKDRKMLERSIDLSSNEMIALNEQLRKDILARIESEKRYRLVHETPFLGIAYGTIDGHLQSANEAFCRMTGYSADELMHMHFSDFTHPEDVEKELPLIQGLIAGESDSYRMEKRYVAKNGRISWVELNVTSSTNEKGIIEYVIATVTDISQRKEAEEALELALDRLKQAQEIGKLGHWEVDLKTWKSTWSDEAFRIYGYRQGETEASYELFLKHIHPDDYEMVKTITSESMQAFNSFSFQHRIIDTKGVQKHIFAIGRYEMDKSGRPVRLFGISLDMTALMETEEQLRQSNERYEFVTKATNDVIWDWDIVNNRVFRSQNFTQIFGTMDENEGTMTNWLSRVHPEDRELVSGSVEEKLGHPDSPGWEAEYRFFRSNGELGYVHDRGYVILNARGEPVRMVGAMRDITPEKLYAIERERTTSRLIKQNRDLEQFAYIVSHNLRAPVANIIGLARIIRSDRIDEATQQQCIDGLAQSVKKLDDVITDLNFVLQVRHGVNEKKENVHFSTLIEDIKASVNDLIRKENICINTDFSEIDEMFTMKSYLYSIFYNLISNSIKYRSAARQPEIIISSHLENGSVSLRFRDNGIGIDLQANGRNLFGLYKRFHPNTEGKGMGLFMVKTQVETLGGKISVQSRVNEGTQFLLEFNTQTAAATA